MNDPPEPLFILWVCGAILILRYGLRNIIRAEIAAKRKRAMQKILEATVDGFSYQATFICPNCEREVLLSHKRGRLTNPGHVQCPECDHWQLLVHDKDGRLCHS